MKYLIAIFTFVMVVRCTLDPRIAGGSSETETGTITGQVVNGNSTGIAGALVGIKTVSPLDSPSVSAVLASGRQTTADSNGFFTFPLVSKGDYAVAALTPDSMTGLARVNVVAGDTAHAVITVDLHLFPMLYKSWILSRITADTGAGQSHLFDTAFTTDASPEILSLSPMNSTFGYCQQSGNCSQTGSGSLTIGGTTLQFDTMAPVVFHFKSPYDTLVIESAWKVNGLDVPLIKYYQVYQGPLPPSGWPQTLCNDTNSNLRLLRGKALEPDGTPVTGQVIQILYVSTPGLMPYPVATDSGGNFRFFVKPGTYTLHVPWSYLPPPPLPPLMVYYGIRPDIATDTQAVVSAISDTAVFVYRMYPRDTVISGTIIDTVSPANGVAPVFTLWVELTNTDSAYTLSFQTPVSPVSDTIAGAGAFSIRVSNHFPLYRLRWGNARFNDPSFRGTLGLRVSDSSGIAPGTAGIKLTVVRLN